MKSANDVLIESVTYREVLYHRRKCPKWNKKFCLECFAGGLTEFTRRLIKEKIIK